MQLRMKNKNLCKIKMFSFVKFYRNFVKFQCLEKTDNLEKNLLNVFTFFTDTKLLLYFIEFWYTPSSYSE